MDLVETVAVEESIQEEVSRAKRQRQRPDLATLRPDLVKHPACDPVLNIEEAACYLQRHPQTVRELVRIRELGCLRDGQRGWLLFRLSQLNSYLKRLEQKPSRAI